MGDKWNKHQVDKVTFFLIKSWVKVFFFFFLEGKRVSTYDVYS